MEIIGGIGMLAGVSIREIDRDEEKINAITHAIGIGLGLIGSVWVIYAAATRGTDAQLLAAILYAATLMGTYIASTFSHVFTGPRTRQFFRTADQAMIYLYIAASWTPMAVTWMTSAYWLPLHIALWTVGLIGFAQKVFFAHRVEFGTVSTGLYVLQGFLPLVLIVPLIRALPTGMLIWLLLGGLCFAVGLIFFRIDHRVRYFHALWHTMVIAGSTCHFLGIIFYCTTAR